MEFCLSADQTMFQDSVKALLGEAASLDKVRAAASGEECVARAIDAGLVELGATMILVPEAYGGLGLGLLDAGLVQEALGRSVAPGRFLATSMAVVGLLGAGSESQKQAFLPRIAAGEVRFGVAVAERVGAHEAAGVAAVDGALLGKSLFVLGSAGATHIMVADKDGTLHIVAADAAGLKRTALTAIDKTRDFAELRFENTEAERLTGENDIGAAADSMVGAGRILVAADTLGASQAMLDMAVAYAAERKQFDRVIGSFQAVKHLCAEMAAEIEPSRALVWHAAYAFDNDPEGALLACLAKAHLAEVGTFVARTSTEVHGGMGFTDLVGLHYWFKRIGTNRQLLGGPVLVRDAAAKLQGWA